MTKARSKKQRRNAKKLFPKLPHNTRPFTSKDLVQIRVFDMWINSARLLDWYMTLPKSR